MNSDPNISHTLFKEKHFLLFWAARLCTAMAYQMQTVAVGWQIYAMTGSAYYLGFVGLVQFLPMLFLTLFVGHVADHYNRKTIIRVFQAIRGLSMAFLAWGTLAGWLDKNILLVTVMIIGAAGSFESPSMQASLPGLVKKEAFPKAAAMSAVAFQIATILGPAFGGLLYSIHAASIYIASSCLMLGALLFVSLIPFRQTRAENRGITFESLFAGIAYIRSQKIILGAISMDLFAVLLGGATALLPIYAKDILHTGVQGLGLLRSAPAIGAVAISIFLARFHLKKRVGKILYVSVAIFGMATLSFALSKSFLLSLISLIILGASDMISVIIRQSLVQLNTPDAMRGRVSAVNSMFIGTSNQLGEFESGITAAWFGAVPAAALGGIGTLIVVGLWIFLFPALYESDKL